MFKLIVAPGDDPALPGVAAKGGDLLPPLPPLPPETVANRLVTFVDPPAFPIDRLT